MSEPAGVAGGFSRFRIDLAYDGTDFAGWAKQPGLRTVQGELLSALEQIFGTDDSDFGMRVAGRTDAGVHADHQVCHVDLSPAQLSRLGRSSFSAKRLNGLLAEDVRVLGIAVAPAGFDARFSATGRSYRYQIADDKVAPDPKLSRYVLMQQGELDLADMNKAAKLLIGLRDFGAFCRPREGATTIRELRNLELARDKDEVISVFLEADAFCHNMVRALVGGLIAVGLGKLTPDELLEIQLQAKRVSKFKVVDPRGLSLSGISYPSDDKLSLQAEKARNKRDAGEISV
jgi:tRNA pseudouridine38-40 synthase